MSFEARKVLEYKEENFEEWDRREFKEKIKILKRSPRNHESLETCNYDYGENDQNDIPDDVRNIRDHKRKETEVRSQKEEFEEMGISEVIIEESSDSEEFNKKNK